MKFVSIFLAFLIGCAPRADKPENVEEEAYLIVLGNVQDAGSPQAGCEKKCCKDLFKNPDHSRRIVSLGLIDDRYQKSWLFEATPDMPAQLKMLSNESKSGKQLPDGIFLSHAHIGHYTGLMFLGKESMNADQVPVYTMPRMGQFLISNGPWSQLVEIGNINVQSMSPESPISLSPNIQVEALLVPHRDEFSETIGYRVSGKNKSALFIPDIDKWDKWERSISALIQEVDYAFLDATFFDGNEVKRDISEIPHPFVVESMDLFEDLPSSEKSKIHFIHFNHTNPLLDPESSQTDMVLEAGYNVARFGDKFPL